MKSALVSLDKHGTGRVPLNVLYEQPRFNDSKGRLMFRFAESQKNLRENGALDESVPSEPKLLISNYVLGPENCYRIRSYLTYCCLSECDYLMSEIERFVQGPTSSPSVLLSLVTNLSFILDDEAAPISDALVSKLDFIAERRGGVVPLHSRLFAQWLHFVFPLECPYPHVSISHDATGKGLFTSFVRHETNSTSRLGGPVRSVPGSAEDVDPALSQWTDDEIMPLVAEEQSTVERSWWLIRALCFDCAIFSTL